MGSQESQWLPSGPPAYIYLELPASASLDQAKHRTDAQLAGFGRAYYLLSFIIDWRPPDDSEWTGGDICGTPSQ